MGYLGEPPETRFGRILRYICYFLFGALLGLGPAVWLMMVSKSHEIAWRIPALVSLGSGLLFCLLGIMTRGRLLGGLLRLFGKNVDWPWW
jgi:hypothetical protein